MNVKTIIQFLIFLLIIVLLFFFIKNTFLEEEKDLVELEVNENEEVVITKRNPGILKLISENTNGQYIDGNNTKNVVEFVTDLLKKLEKKEFEAKKFVSYKDQFQIFIFISFILLLIELFIFEKETIWLKKLNLFNEKKSE